MVLKKKIGIVLLASVLSILIGACVALFGDLFSNEGNGSVGTGENGSSNGNGSTISTEGYEDFYGTYSRDYVYPYGGDIKVSLYENGKYEISEMYIQTNGYYRQVTESGTYTKTVGFDDEEILIVWIFKFNPATSTGIQNGDYFTLNMGYYTENLWKDRTFFYGHRKNSSEPTLYMVVENAFLGLEYVVPTYSLYYSAGIGGKLTGELSQTLKMGMNGSAVTAIADDGYEFVEWSDGVKTATRQDVNVQGNISVTAQFRMTSPVYQYGAGVQSGRGQIVTSSNKALESNNYTVTATAVPETGWGFYAWSDGVKSATRTDVLTDDFYVEAIFGREITLTVVTEGGTVACNGQQGKTIKVLLLEDSAEFVSAIAEDGYYFWGWAISESLDPWYFGENMYLYYNSAESHYYLKFRRYED